MLIRLGKIRAAYGVRPADEDCVVGHYVYEFQDDAKAEEFAALMRAAGLSTEFHDG